MDFCRRAEQALEREEPARALMILVRGLRRHPGDEEAIDLLLLVFTRHIDTPGMETEILRGLEFHDHRGALVRLAIDELRGLDKGSMAGALEEVAEAEDVAVADPEILRPDDSASDDEAGDETRPQLSDSGATEVLSRRGVETTDGDREARKDGGRSEESTGEASGAESDDSKAGSRRLIAVAVLALIVVVVGSILFVGWQYVREVRQNIAVDEAMVALDPAAPGPVLERLDEAKNPPGVDAGLRQRERFVDALVALEAGETSGASTDGEARETQWGLAAAALEAAQRREWEEAMRFVHHLERAHDDTLPSYFTRGRICELRGDWECALARYGRVQHHFPDFAAARTGAMRVAAHRFDRDRWRREQSRLADRRPDHPYADADWIDPFGETDSEETAPEVDDAFLTRWRAVGRLARIRDRGGWDELRERCSKLGADNARPMPTFEVICGQGAAEAADVETARDYFFSAARRRGLTGRFYRNIQIHLPRILADLGRSDLGLELVIPYDDTPLEKRDGRPGGDEAETDFAEPPAHFRGPSDEIGTDEAKALLVRGRVLIDHGATARARQTLAPVATRSDVGARARYELARSHLVEGNADRATRAIGQIGEDRLESGARAYRAYLKGNHSRARAFGWQKGEDPRLRRIQALALLADGRGREAMRLLEGSRRGLEGLVLRPVQLRAFARAGEQTARAGVRERLPAFGEATTVDVLVDVASAAYWQRDFETADGWLKRVLDRVANHPEANWQMGLLRRARGDAGAARRSFVRAWRGDQNSVEWLVESGRVHLDAGRYEEAREAFLAAALRDRADVDAVRGLGQAYLEGNRSRGRRDLAGLLDNYGSVASEQPARAEMNRWLAVLHGAREGDEEALSYLRRAREVGGDRAPILVELGRYYGANNQWERAREHFATALRVDPTIPEIHLGLARASRALGDREEAGDHLDRLLEMVPVGDLRQQARAELDELEESSE